MLNKVLTLTTFCLTLCQNFLIKNPFLIIDLNDENTSLVTSFKYVNSSYYDNMLLVDNYLYLTGLNYIFKLNASKIDLINDGIVYYKRIFPIVSNKNRKLFNENSDVNTYMTYLGMRKSEKDLVLCNTDNGIARILHLNPNDLSFSIEYRGDHICPTNVKHKNLALISDNDESHVNKGGFLKGIMYSATWFREEESEKYGIFSQYGIFRRDTESAEKYYLYSLPNKYWLWEPEFVGIFEDKSHVFYFFTEYSIEDYNQYRNNKTIDQANSYLRVARVARVCKHGNLNVSNASWTTYRKIKIECINHANQNTYSNLTLIKLLLDNETIIAIFHMIIDYTLKNNYKTEYLSVICEYKLSNMNQMFKIVEFFRFNFNEEKALYPNLDCNQAGNNTEDDYDDQVSGGYEYERKSYEKFLETHTILNKKLSFSFKFSINHKINTMNVDYLTSSFQIFYLSTHDGCLIKLIRQVVNETLSNANVYYKLTTMFRFGDGVSNNILDSLFNNNLKSIYLSTLSEVLMLDFKNYCFKYITCHYCTYDPYCEWMSNRCKYKSKFNQRFIFNDENILTFCKNSIRLVENIINLNACLNDTVVLRYDLNENRIMLQYFDNITKPLSFHTNFNGYNIIANKQLYLLHYLKWYKDKVLIDAYENATRYQITINGDLILLSIDFNHAGNYTFIYYDNENDLVANPSNNIIRLNVYECLNKNFEVTQTYDSKLNWSHTTLTSQNFTDFMKNGIESPYLIDFLKQIHNYSINETLGLNFYQKCKYDFENFIQIINFLFQARCYQNINETKFYSNSFIKNFPSIQLIFSLFIYLVV